jgi:hypothetical protein
MRKSDPIQDELDQIRIKIYEETKHMSSDKIHEYFRKTTEKAAKKYGFTIGKPLHTTDDNQSTKE